MNLLKTSLIAMVVLAGNSLFAQFKQTPLSYPYNAFESTVDAQTMEIHYSKHAAGYTSNLNKAIVGTDLEKQNLNTILANVSKSSVAVRNNAGGHYNHELFWTILTPKKGTEPSSKLLRAIETTFGSLDNLKKEISDAGAKRFGSGWAWLSVDASGKLFVSSTGNQDNPLMDVVEQRGTPVLGIDVWEHAYYLKYQNKRVDYLNSIWSIINWEEVSRRYEHALKK